MTRSEFRQRRQRILKISRIHLQESEISNGLNTGSPRIKRTILFQRLNLLQSEASHSGNILKREAEGIPGLAQERAERQGVRDVLKKFHEQSNFTGIKRMKGMEANATFLIPFISFVLVNFFFNFCASCAFCGSYFFCLKSAIQYHQRCLNQSGFRDLWLHP